MNWTSETDRTLLLTRVRMGLSIYWSLLKIGTPIEQVPRRIVGIIRIAEAFEDFPHPYTPVFNKQSPSPAMKQRFSDGLD